MLQGILNMPFVSISGTALVTREVTRNYGCADLAGSAGHWSPLLSFSQTLLVCVRDFAALIPALDHPSSPFLSLKINPDLFINAIIDTLSFPTHLFPHPPAGVALLPLTLLAHIWPYHVRPVLGTNGSALMVWLATFWVFSLHYNCPIIASHFS